MATKISSQMAVISTRMLKPFIAEIEQVEHGLQKVFAKSSLDSKHLQQEMLPSQLAWEFVETAALVLDDQMLGFRIGHQTPAHSLPNLRHHNLKSMTLSEIFATLIVDVKHLTNQSDYSLSYHPKHASFRRRLTFRPLKEPAQSDGFLSGLLTRIIQSAIGEFWDAKAISINVTNINCIPNKIIPNSSLITGSKEDFLYRFPAEWLLLGNSGRLQCSSTDGIPVSSDLLSSVRMLIEQHLTKPDLDGKWVATHFSMSERTLQQRLAELGTTLRSETAAIRMAKAKELLADKERLITATGKMVGFETYTSFIRAFRRSTGMTPSQYRARNLRR